MKKVIVSLTFATVAMAVSTSVGCYFSLLDGNNTSAAIYGACAVFNSLCTWTNIQTWRKINAIERRGFPM